MPEATERDVEEVVVGRLRDLQVDLGDGDDLAMAIQLIGDALHRRIRRVKRSLRELHSLTDDPQLEHLTSRVHGTLARYQEDLNASHKQLREVIQSFQEDLQQSAAAIEKQLDRTP